MNLLHDYFGITGFFVAPEFVFVSTKIPISPDESASSPKEATIHQRGVGLGAGIHYWVERDSGGPIGLMLRLGVTQYGSSKSGVPGATAFYVTIGAFR